MNISTLILILKRQFFTKWGRFLLASGGIMIGIWAITLTTSLSIGLQDTVISAFNSQSTAKQVYIGKLEGGKTDYNIFDTSIKYVAVGKKDIEEVKKINNITNVVPDALFANNFLNLVTNVSDNQDFSCFNESIKFDLGDVKVSELENTVSEFDNNCLSLSFDNFLFEEFYESNRADWVGKTSLDRDEIALCFECSKIGEKLGVQNPEDLLGKQIDFEFANAPTNYKPGDVFDLQNTSFGVVKLTETKTITLKIGAVIDDRKAESERFGPPTQKIYIDPYYYDEGIKLGDPLLNDNEIGYFQLNGYIDSYDNLETVINDLNDNGFTATSFVRTLINGLSIAFSILTIVLSSLGVIAIIASIFGIINVMTISVLERKKEIGILKSLGSKDSDILKIFIIESASLGVIGWIFGTLLALFSGFIITTILKFLIETLDGWAENLEVFNISNVTPIFPWWLFIGTLIIAILSTVISGLIPAIKASRQNPIEVLRSE